MEVHLGIETYPSQKGVKDHTMVMKPIAVYPLWYQLKVQKRVQKHFWTFRPPKTNLINTRNMLNN
mgnify:CR=1 FL=1